MLDPKDLSLTIVGAPEEKGFPSVCLIEMSEGFSRFTVCSGVLIAPNLVLSAAHCVDFPRITTASCTFFLKDKGNVTVRARKWFWGKAFDQNKSEGRTVNGNLARLRAVSDDFAILELENPVDIKVTPMLPFDTLSKLVDEGKIRSLKAVGFGRFSKSDVINLAQGANVKRSFDFDTFQLNEETKTINVVATQKSEELGENISVSTGDSGGPFFANVDGVNYVVGLVSTVSKLANGNIASASILSVDNPYFFFRGSLLKGYVQTVGKLGFDFIEPHLDISNAEQTNVQLNACGDGICPQERPLTHLAIVASTFYVLYKIQQYLKNQ